MKKLLFFCLCITLILSVFCPLMGLAEPGEVPVEPISEYYPDDTFWGEWGYETVEEFMEWVAGNSWREYKANDPFWKVWYSESQEDFMRWNDVDEEEYQVLEEAWQKARDKALEEVKRRQMEELEELGGTPGIINVMYNGSFIKFTGATPEIIDGSTFVPAKVFFEFLGATVVYNALTREITAETEDWSVGFVIGRDTMSITEGDGAPHELPIDVSPYIKNGVSYIPVRAVAEHLGLDVYWDKTFRAVVVLDSKEIIEEIDKDFTVVNSLLKMSLNQTPDDEATYKTVLDMLISITQFDSLDGDKTSDAGANITVITDGLNFYLTGVIDVSALYKMIIYEWSYSYNAYDDEELEEMDAIAEMLRDVTGELIFNYDEGMLYIKVPILSEAIPELPKDAWIAISGLDDYINGVSLNELITQLGVEAFADGASVGTILYADAVSNSTYYDYDYDYNYDYSYDYSDYYSYYSYFPISYRAFYIYAKAFSTAEYTKALIGDDKFVRSSDDYTLTLTYEELLAIQEEYDEDSYIREFDLKIKIMTKDDEITGISGGFVYRSDTYYSYSDTRYTCEFDISQKEIQFSLEIHERNSIKILIEANSKTAETDTTIPSEPPEGDEIIPFEDLLGDYWGYYPDFDSVVPLLSFL